MTDLLDASGPGECFPSVQKHFFEESVALNKEVGDRAATAESLMSLARVLTSQGDRDSARHLFEESFQLLQEIHDREFFPLCLESLAGVIAGQGEQERAACLWGAAEALRETVGNPIPPLYLLDTSKRWQRHASNSVRKRLLQHGCVAVL